MRHTTGRRFLLAAVYAGVLVVGLLAMVRLLMGPGRGKVRTEQARIALAAGNAHRALHETALALQ